MDYHPRSVKAHPAIAISMFDFFIKNPVVLGICFWRKGRGNPGWAEYMGEKGGCYSVNEKIN